MILAIDTSTGDVVVGASVTPGEAVEVRVEPGEGRPRHATALLGAIEDAVAEAGGWDLVEAIGVGTGPGGFTGLRVGISTARALGGARELPVRAISGLEALRRAAADQAGAEAVGSVGVAVIDARRGEVFVADAEGSAVVEPPEQLGSRLAQGGRKSLLAGDGAVRFRQLFEDAGAIVPADGDEVHRISAARLCELAREAPDQRPVDVKPTYLRRPDAEIWLERDRPDN